MNGKHFECHVRLHRIRQAMQRPNRLHASVDVVRSKCQCSKSKNQNKICNDMSAYAPGPAADEKLNRTDFAMTIVICEKCIQNLKMEPKNEIDVKTSDRHLHFHYNAQYSVRTVNLSDWTSTAAYMINSTH